MNATSFRLRAWLLAGGLVCLMGLGVAFGQQPLPAPPVDSASPARASDAARDPYTVTVTDEMRAHQRWIDSLYFASSFWGFAVLLLLLLLGISRWARDLARRLSSRPFPMAMVCFALLSVATALLAFPLDVLSGFVIPHRFDLSDQGFGSFLWDQAKALLLGVLIGAPLAGLALGAIRRFRHWWLVIWLGSVPIVVLLVLIAPVVLEPVFNELKPLEDPRLATELGDLAARAGIRGADLFEVDKSKQTKTMNAYVNGLGPTTRIVLWDTIIAKMDREELTFVMAHEMGHYVMHHIWKLLGLFLGVLLVVLWVGQRVAEWARTRWGRRWGFEVLHDPAALPLLLLVASVALFVLTPLVNAVSRHLEVQSDVFALELTRLNDAGARAFVKLAEDSKVLPDPAPLIRFWRYSHPALAERVAFCRSYRPWDEGRPNQLWHGDSGGMPVP